MNKEKLENLIEDFSLKKLNDFLWDANFKEDKQDLSSLNSEGIFSDVQKLGEIETDDKKKIVTVATKVANDLSERSGKKKQYDLGKRILMKNEKCDAGIFVFYDNSGSFRFSLIYPTYSGTKMILNNFRRFTYFVGSDLTNKTFKQRIGDGDFSSLEKIKDAFSVEKVTEEFYLEYHKLFENLLKEFSKNHTFIFEAERNDINVENFSKKLLGQIVFLYFLQRKGWLGAPKNKSLNEGDKNFLRNLYNGKYIKFNNYFNDILEPLFYGALNKKTDKVGSFFRDYFDCQIPFLNGGLFESEYKWEETKIYLDNKIFENILEVFDRYNFTVEEESPDDKEIAIDPEMMGKVFENLLSDNLRKGKGTYYTPREIVHYMCQESLMSYLVTRSKINEKLIRKLITRQDIIPDKELSNLSDEDEIEEAADKNIFLDKPQAKLLDELLREIKVVDPACGSGAFLVGMLNEIINARLYLDQWHLGKNITGYNIKKETIQNCIYGVDIDPGAIEIAKLRLWLQLVVDYELKDIEPLPNLDYRLMCGNSLLEEFEGIRFYNGEEPEQKGLLFVDNEKISKINDLKKKVKEYFDIHDDKEKKIKQKEINAIKDWLVRSVLENKKQDLANERMAVEAKAKMLDKKSREKYLASWGNKFIVEAKIKEVLDNLHNPKKEKPFFIWKLEFIDVFEKGGFDIVIANPPYVSVKDINTQNKKILNDVFETGQGRFNLFTLFLEKADQISRLQGIRTFILPEGLYSNIEYRFIRKHILENSSILYIVLFSGRVFDAAVDTSIISTQKANKKDNQFPVIRDLKDQLTIVCQKSFNNLPANLFAVKLDDKSKEIIYKLINSRGDKVASILEIQQGIIYSGQIKENIFSNKRINKSYKKILDGRDILKWEINWNNKKENKYIHYSDKLHRAREERLFVAKEKLLFPRKSSIICGTYDDQQYYVLNTAYVCLSKTKDYNLKFILAILNSRLINYFYSKLYFGWQITIPALNSIVIPEKSNQKLFIEIVDIILTITKSDDYLENPEKQAQVKEYETQIDQLVYKLYGLKDDEIAIVEDSIKK